MITTQRRRKPQRISLLLTCFVLATLGFISLLGGQHAMANPAPNAAATKIKTKVGKVFSIKLPENPSTGYAWQLAMPADGVTIVKSTFEQKDATEAVGVPGIRVFKLKVSKNHAPKIVFEHKRAWETEVIESHTVEISTGAK